MADDVALNISIFKKFELLKADSDRLKLQDPLVGKYLGFTNPPVENTQITLLKRGNRTADNIKVGKPCGWNFSWIVSCFLQMFETS